MKNGIYKVKPWRDLVKTYGVIATNSEVYIPMDARWTDHMEANCPKSRQIRIFNDKWNISGDEYPVCPEMFEDGPI